VIRILHAIDASTDETALQSLALLIRKGPPEHRHVVCSLDAGARERALRFIGQGSGESPPHQVPVELVHRRICHALNWAPGLTQVARDARSELVHAWGIEAAAACAARLADRPLILALLDPGSVRAAASFLRSIPRKATLAAGSQVIRSRLIGLGVDPARLVVIRGGVDFAAINQARKGDLRTRFAGEAAPIILLHAPASRGGGQFYGLWACAIVRQIHANLRVILPYDSPEARRLKRFVRQIRMAGMLASPPPDATWSELVAAADLLLAAAVDEICIEPLATAMAAGIPIVGSAVRSVAELIADRHNGFLCKPKEPRALAAKILAALEDAELRRKVVEAARGQAFEMFSSRAFADNHARLYANALAGAPASEGIRDTAMVA